MSRRSQPPMSWWGIAILMAVAVLGTLALVRCEVSDCEARGGHWRPVDRSGVCVGSDGRILP